MVGTRAHRLPRVVGDAISREDLLEFVRSWAPDLRIRTARVDGVRVVGARFTFRGEELVAEQAETAEHPDPDTAVVRRCAWLLQRRLGIPTVIENAKRREMEQQIVSASLRGDTATADTLARELALANEGMRPTPARLTRFEDFGGSMFERTSW